MLKIEPIDFELSMHRIPGRPACGGLTFRAVAAISLAATVVGIMRCGTLCRRFVTLRWLHPAEGFSFQDEPLWDGGMKFRFGFPGRGAGGMPADWPRKWLVFSGLNKKKPRSPGR